MRMEQTTHAPGQLRRILPGVLLAAGLVWLMTGLFAPLTLGLLLAALMDKYKTIANIAAHLNVNRSTLYRKARAFGLL